MDPTYLGSGPFPPPEPPSNGAQELVEAGWAQAQTYADESFTRAITFLDDIAGLVNDLTNIPSVNVELSPVAAAVHAYVSPDVPVEPANLDVNLPPAPGELVLTDVLPLSVVSAPEFTATAPALSIPTAPGALTVSVPLQPTLADVAVPVEDPLNLPDVPTLLGINIPGVPLLNMPAFDAVLAIAPTAPGNTFAFTEDAYTSTLLTSLKSILQTWVDGASTGIAPAVEQAIWDRGRAREATVAARKMQETLRDFSSRGFTKPPGAMALALQEALQNTQDVDLAASREVMIKQADLEQTNRRFAFEQAFQVESALIEYQNRIAQRAFDTAKYAQEAAIAIYVAQVQGYTAEIQAYGEQARVFKTLIEAELAKLEVYKTELEGQKLIGELNVQSVEIYKARITAAVSLVEVFKARIEAANLVLQGNKIRIDGFAAEVEAYDSQVKAKTAEYQGFATLMQAEVARVEMFKGQAEAYRSQVEGYRAGVEAGVQAKQIELDVKQRVPLEVHKTRAEVFRIQTDAESRRVDAGTKVYGTRAQVFESQVRGEAARVGAEVDVYKAESEVEVAEGGLRIEAARANIQKMQQQVTMLLEAVKAGAQVSAQLASSALSAVNLSGQIGDHVSYSASIAASNSAALNVSQINSETTITNVDG